MASEMLKDRWFVGFVIRALSTEDVRFDGLVLYQRLPELSP